MRRNGKTQQAAATTTQTAAITTQPAATTTQPAAVTMQPAAITMQPAATSMQPAQAITMQPAATSMQPVAITMQAAAITMQAAATSMQAAAVTPQPSARSRRHLTSYRSTASIEQRLMAAQVALDAVLQDVALQSALAPCGYDLAQILEGKALHDQAQALSQQQQARAGDQRSAMDARAAARAQAHALYKRQITLARVALRDDAGATKTLDLAAARKRSPAGWLTQAQKFYANALKDAAILAKLATRGVTREQLEQGQAQIAAVAASVVAHQQRKGVKQETTQARDAALRALDRWMQDFVTVVRVALAEQSVPLDEPEVVETAPLT